MKIRPLLLTLLFALAMPLAMLGQDELTVYDGTTTNSYVPIEPAWTDVAQHSECIIPSAALSEMAGSDVISMKYYASSNFSFTGTFQVYLKEIEDAAFSGTSYYGSADANTVYTGTLTIESKEMIISFDEAYHYQGGNLLVGFSKESGGNYSYFSFYGQNVANASIAAHGSSSPTVRNFIPKTTFTYIESEPYPKPRNLRASNITATAATLSWNAGGTEDHWDLYYTTSSVAPEEETTPTESNISTNSIRLTDLSNGDTYYAYVRANYNNGEHYSAWTPACVFVAICSNPTNLHIVTITSNTAQLDWTNGGDDTAWQLAMSGQSSFDPNAVTPVDITEKPYTLTSLVSGSTYYVCVRSNCGDGVSEWSNTCSFTVGCFAPTIVESQTQVACDMAYITWNEGGTETSWQVVYSDQQGFNPDAANPETVTTQYKVFENLITGTTYYARVRAICATGDYSEWTAETSFTPQCLAPSQLKVMNVSVNSAKLKWNVGSTETQWQISYSTTENFNQEDGNIVTVSTNPYVLEGLTVNTIYYAYVRAVCGNNIKSDWSNVCTFMPRYEHTVSDGTNYNSYIPVCCIATNYTTKSQFIIPAADLTDLQYGNITKLTFYAISETANLGAATFDVLFNELDGVTVFDANEFFDWSAMTTVYSGSLSISGSKMEITLSTPYQYLGGDLLIGIQQTNSGNSANIGWYGAETTGYSAYGGYELSYSNSYSRYKYIPKTTISYVPGTAPTCLKPKNLAASNVGATSATLSWTNGGNETAWVVEYATDANFTQNSASVNVSTNPYTLTGLTPETTYYARVKTDCGNGDYSGWSNVCSFTPSAIQTVVINDGTSTNYYVPFYGYYANSYNLKSQFIIPSSQLEEVVGGSITKLTFYTSAYYSDVSFPDAVFECYFLPTELTEFASSSPVDWSTLTEVYSGSLSISNNMMEVTLSTPYLYTGGNLLVGLQETTMSSSGDFVQWLGVETTYYSAYYYASYNGRTKFLPKMSVTYSGASCSSPDNLAVSGVATNSATFTWTVGGNETAWKVQYKETTATDWSEAITVAQPTCTIDNLLANTTYEMRVQADCGGGDFSLWTTKAFAITPYGLTVSDITTSSATFTWTPVANETSWQVQYKKATDVNWSEAIAVNGTPTCSLSSLDYNTEYQVRVRADLGSGNYSDLASTQFTTEMMEWHVVYVTPTGAGTMDGLSWDNAMSNIRLAQEQARSISQQYHYTVDVWVAEGTYFGDGTYDTDAFRMVGGVNVYGGFAGTETLLSERNVSAHPTILSGSGEKRVLQQTSTSNAATWDGFILENGKLTSGSGAGAYLLRNGTLRNCIIRNDTIVSTSGSGAGVRMERGILENCEIYGNYIQITSNYQSCSGVGVYMQYGTVNNCDIHDNDANSGMNVNGAGVYCYYGTITNSYIHHNGNTDKVYGGGLYIKGSQAYVASATNCIIENNQAISGGGVYCGDYATLTNSNVANNKVGIYVVGNYVNIVSCNIVNNRESSLSSHAGGVYFDYTNISNCSMVNCIVWGNTIGASSSSQLGFWTSSDLPSVRYCAIQGGYGGVGNIDLSAENEGSGMHPYFTSPTTGTGANFSGGDWSLQEQSCCINQGTTEGLSLPQTDLAGNARVQQGAIDIGAYESPYDAVVLTPDSHGILYVTTTGAGTMDGSSWANATDNLQLAVNRAAAYGSTTQVWVAQGTYQGNVNQENAFAMVENIMVYGSFVGNEAYDYDLNQRDFVAHSSVLDGQNAQRVLLQHNDFPSGSLAVWDGFSLTQGKTQTDDGYAAGACIKANGELRNCRIYGNTRIFDHFSGNNNGGVTVVGNATSPARLTNCWVYDNEGFRGAGVYAKNAVLTNCLIFGNEALSYGYSSNYGGGVYADGNVTMLHCGIYDNTAGNGGGLYVAGNGVTMQNSVVWGNHDNQGNPIANRHLLEATCSAVEGGIEGVGNINLAAANTGEVMSPNFTDPTNGDWTLQSGSILINKGVTLANHPENDLLGNARVQQGHPDLGPFESGYATSYNIVADANGIVYVSANGTGDGSSWANAAGDLQLAVNRAAAMSPVPMVWVSAGVYNGQWNSVNAFTMAPGVEVYGGFVGTESASFNLDDRDFAAHPTILDGSNVRRVLYQPTAFTETTAAIWDGFVIQNGNATEIGQDFGGSYGGGVFMRSYSHLNNCFVKANVAGNAGGVFCEGYTGACHNTLMQCEIVNNTSEGMGGGGMLTGVALTNCRINGNTAVQYGGLTVANGQVVNCEMVGNQAQFMCGGLYLYDTDCLNSTIVNNVVTIGSSGDVGGLYVDHNNATHANLILWGNKVGEDYSQYYYQSGNSFTYSAVQGGSVTGTGNMALNDDNDGEGSGNYVRFIAPDLGIFKLGNASSLIGMGTNDVTGLPEKDLAGHVRIDGTVEPGAYEHYCTNVEIMNLALESGGSYNFHGTVITEPGVYQYEWTPSGSDCDSLVIAQINTSDGIWYVTATGAGTKDGTSWANASDNLYQMVATVAQQPGYGKKQIWVAEGTYSGNATGAHFNYAGGVEVHGGFAGNETQLDQRDIENHPTILEGTSNRVLLAPSTAYPCTDAQPGLWEGMTLQGGQQIMVNEYMTLQNCRVSVRTAVTNGMVKQCDFTGFSDNGNAILVRLDEGAVMDSCTVHHNNVRNTLVRAQNATVRYSLFYNNTVNGNYVQADTYNQQVGILDAIDNSDVDHCDFLNNRIDYSTNFMNIYALVNEYHAGTELVCSPQLTVVGLHGSTMRNSIIWGNEQGVFTRNFIAKDLSSEVSYCAIESGLYNGIGNLRLAEANEGNLFAPAFVGAASGAGYLVGEDADWHLAAASVCLKQGEDGSDIGALGSEHPAVLAVTPSANNIIYVDAAGTGDGSSWANATPHLQYAVARANTFNPVAQVWVKEGTYYSESSDSLVSAFNVVAGVEVYGGFAGTEASVAERDLEAHPTYLDGQNACRVLYQNESFGDGQDAIWDGFVIRNGFMSEVNKFGYNSSLVKVDYNGNYYYSGASYLYQMHGAGASLLHHAALRNCRLENNRIELDIEHSGLYLGAALSAYGSQLSQVFFENNTADYAEAGVNVMRLGSTYLFAVDTEIEGGEMHQNVGRIVMFGCTVDGTRFTENQVRPVLPETDDLHEAVLHVEASTLRHCVFSNNNAVAVGKLNVGNAYYPNVFINCQMDHNRPLAVIGHSKAYGDTFINCNICDNTVVNPSSTAYPVSGGIFHNTVVWGNRVGAIPAHFNVSQLESTSSFNNCAVELGLEGYEDEVIALASNNRGTSLAYNYPCFLAPNSGDYSLSSGSALVDAGDGSVVDYDFDLMGNPRVNDGIVDVGAYESKCLLYREYSDVTTSSAYPFYGEWLTESGQYVHRWAISSECDSVVVLNLSFMRIIYVTENGSGLMNGTSWENAYGDLRLATEDSGQTPLDKTQIWVAEGTYRGDGTSVNAFKLYPNVEMYGGLNGTELSSYDLTQRDLEHHVTILDGDYIQRVIYQVDDCTEATACVIDGFTIKNGFSRQDVDEGTALYLKRHCHVRNCKITENYTSTGVDAIHVHTADFFSCEQKLIFVTFENCEITNNQGSRAVFADHTAFTDCNISQNDGLGVHVVTYTRFDNCQLSNNGQNTSGVGRALYLEFGHYSFGDATGMILKKSIDYLDMTNCLIANNRGGIYYADSGTHGEANITNCVIDRNNASRTNDNCGGAICSKGYNVINIASSTIINNTASGDGGALYGTNFHVVNTILSGNKAGGKVNQLSGYRYNETSEGPIMVNTTLDIRYSAIEGGYPGEGNILLNGSDLPVALNGYRLRQNSVCINNGTSEGVTLPEYDMAGQSRVKQGRIDIGAYESDYTGRTVITPDIGNIIYVSKEGSGTKDGSSWENATPHFQMAMNMALCYDPVPQVWVKAGHYDNLDAENVQFWSDLAMMPGVNVVGGFNGSEPATFQLNYRQLNNNLTILDGKGKRRVVEQYKNFNEGEQATWDGFIIRNGQAQKGYTSLIQAVEENTVIGCLRESMMGGGVMLRCGGNIVNSEISNNVAHYGGGISRVDIQGLTANFLNNDKISNNYAIVEGGGLYHYRDWGVLVGFSKIDTIANCEFSDNKAPRYGAMLVSRATLMGCSIIHNTTESYAFDTISSVLACNRYENCVLWGNDSRNYAFQTEGRYNTYAHCAIQGGREGEGNINLSSDNTGEDPSQHYPFFVDVTEQVYQPMVGSAVANVGNNAAVLGDLDLAFKPRVKDGIVDMGAYEETCINYRHLRVIANDHYVFYGRDLTESGRYQYRWTPAGMECDSLVSLDLEIRKIWYVKEGGAGSMDGSSWDNAFADLNAALTEAGNYETEADKQIWVAAGTYSGNGYSSQAFTLRPGVSVYGGFAGNEENGIDFDERDLATNVTILDGSHSQRVVGNAGVETTFGPTKRGLIDGFTIQNGYTTENGGGVYAVNYITVSHCILKNNQAGRGAGIYVSNHGEVTDCDIFSNTALHDGGGAYVSSSTLTYCHLHNNLCDNWGSGFRRGGGIYGANATINNCLIDNNSVLTDQGFGGGMYIANSQEPSQLLNCTMVNNYSFNQAGGVYSENHSSNNEFINCVLWGNRTDLNTQQVAVSASNVPIFMRYSAVQGGCAGIGNINLSAENDGSSLFAPHFVSPSSNVGANYSGGDWHFAEGSILANHGERLEYTLTHDLDGTTSLRVENGRIDIGAYESAFTNDYALTPDAHNIIYVNASNTSGNLSGDSWSNAIPDLQQAINFAGDDDNHPKIWIAGGTYTGNGWPYVDAFVALNGIDLYGGFAGNEPYDYDLNLRDLNAHQTILDGQNIQRTLQQATNDYFKYRRLETQQFAHYDGITFRNGFVYMNDGGNLMMQKGELRDCVVEYGHSLDGTFGAGGLYASNNVTAVRTAFRNNKAENGDGGAVYNGTYYDCLFANNSALNGNGGASMKATHYNSTIVNNYASQSGGGVYTSPVNNSIVWGNKVGNNEPGNFPENTNEQVAYSAIEGGYNGSASVVHDNITLNTENTGNAGINYPRFANPTLAAGADFSGGDWTLLEGSVCINHGSNDLVAAGDLDLNRHQRIQVGAVDMGCYESPYDFEFEIVPDANNIIYVTQNGAGEMNGSSWANATPYLQYAMERAAIYSPKPVIWMAEGIYIGDGEPDHPAFRLTNGVSVYGGFAGDEPASFDLSQRDFDVHITVIDGQNVQPLISNNTTTSLNTIISGITFRNGRTGVLPSKPQISGCQIEYCKFIDNAYVVDIKGGGALYPDHCNIFHCEFIDNYSTSNGGALYLGSTNVINWCLIKGNTANGYGGGIFSGGLNELYNSEISFNHSDGWGGGIYGLPVMKNCDVVKNTVELDNWGLSSKGGGIYVTDADLGSGGSTENYASNNIIWGNRAGALASNVREASPGTLRSETMTYTAIESDEFFPSGTGNIALQTANSGNNAGLNYVRFIDPDNGDFSLMDSPQSMCIDAGNNASAAPGDYDLAGNERVSNETIDMGCYEQTPVDCHVPSGLDVPEEGIAFTTADVIWNPGGEEDQWMVYLLDEGTATHSMFLVDTTYLHLQDLRPNSDYRVKVRSVCGVDEMSSYTIERHFTTACDPDSIVWTNYLVETGMLPVRDQSVPSNSEVLFSWDYIDGAEYYDLYLWRTDYGNGLPIPGFPVRSNLRTNHATVDLDASYYDGYGIYAHCTSNPECGTPQYLHQYDTTAIAQYAWYVVAYKDCAAIQSDTMTFNTGLPDLHVNTLDCSYAQTGQLMTVQWSVRNDGNVATPTGATWNDYIVLSYPINWTEESFTQANPESFLIATVPNLMALEPNMQYTNQVDVFVPSNMYGSVFLFVLSNWTPYSDMHLDFAPYGGVFPNPYTPDPSGYPYYYMQGTCPSESFDEIVDCDNFFYKQIEVDIPPYPDLIVRNVIPPYEGVAGDSIIVSWQLINQGAAGFEDVPVTDIVYMTTDTIYDASVITLGSINDTLTMAVGDTITRHATFHVDERYIGTYNFFVRTDGTNEVYESLFEGNNMSPISEHPTVLLPAPPPDLAFDSLGLETHVLSPNQTFLMGYKVGNHGYVAAKASPDVQPLVDSCGILPPCRGVRWTDRVYLSDLDSLVVNMATVAMTVYNDTILYTPTEIAEIDTLIYQWAQCHYAVPESLLAIDSALYMQNLAQAQNDIESFYLNQRQSYKNQYLKAINVKVPMNLEEGMYYYYVATDVTDAVFENQLEDNNVVMDSVYVYQPDLKVLFLTLAENRDTVFFSMTNIGQGSLVEQRVDLTVNFNNAVAGTRRVNALTMLPGDTLTMGVPVDIPCNFYTDNSIKVQVTPQNDKDYTNNNYLIEHYQILNPDFMADSLLTPTELNSGDSFDIVYDITNLGNAAYEGEMRLGVYLGLSPELNFITATELTNDAYYPVSLAVGESTTVVQTVTLPIEAQGSYYLYVSINDGLEICEGENLQTNYIVSEPITVTLSPYPDLVVMEAATPGDGLAGSQVTVTYMATNQGIRNIAASETWTDAIYVSNQPSFDANSAELLTYVNKSGPLAMGETYTEERIVYLPATLANDSYFFYFVSDVNNDLFEYVGEYNNVYRSASFPVQEYNLDLAVTNLDGMTDIEWGQRVSYEYTVVNNGSRPTLNNFTDKLFLSLDESFDDSDTVLCISSHSGLAAGASYTSYMTASIPYGFTGDYYVLVVTDATGRNPDTNPFNNVMALPVHISSVPVPDLVVSDLEVLTSYPSCGQPITIRYKVTNQGESATNASYVNRAVYSPNSINNGTLIGNLTHAEHLEPGAYYYDTLNFIVPVPQTGNYAIYVTVNQSHDVFEMNFDNNQTMQPVIVNLNAPGDLVVTSVNHPSQVTAGDPITIRWTVKNNGPNELSGVGYSEVAYLSTDTIFDSEDKLLGSLNFSENLTFPLYTTIEHTLTTNISGVQEGDYYVIVLADARNTFYESNEDNNRGYSATPLSVELPVLAFNTPVEFDLDNFKYKDFKLIVGDNISETVRIYVQSNDSLMGAVNNIYVLKDGVGTNLDYDISTDGQMTSNSELYIARTEAGYYGVSVFGYSPVSEQQHIVIEADILPFEVRSISPDRGGNTGKVTVKMIGSKFRHDMAVQLFKINGNDTVRIVADTLRYVNFNVAYATFDLTGAELGVYSLRADNYCAGSAYLHNCFEVVEGEPENLATNLIIPRGLRANRYCCLTLEYGNIGNTDIVDPRIVLRSLGESWIGLRRGELNVHHTEIEIPTTFEGEPDGILRPGVRHTITIYCYTNAQMLFSIDVNDEIDAHNFDHNVQNY